MCRPGQVSFLPWMQLCLCSAGCLAGARPAALGWFCTHAAGASSSRAAAAASSRTGTRLRSSRSEQDRGLPSRGSSETARRYGFPVAEARRMTRFSISCGGGGGAESVLPLLIRTRNPSDPRGGREPPRPPFFVLNKKHVKPRRSRREQGHAGGQHWVPGATARRSRRVPSFLPVITPW